MTKKMPEKVEKFFRALEYSDFLVMRYLLETFRRMDRSCDESSKKIFENIDVLGEYNIVLKSSSNNSSYVLTEDDLSKSKMVISNKSSEKIVCHEFGHLLLDLFANCEVPEEFNIVNEICQKRLENESVEVSKMLRQYSDEVFGIIQESAHELIEFTEKYPEVEQEYFVRNPEATAEDCIEDFLYSFILLMTNFDDKTVGYNKISNIIDAIHQGENPFYSDYGREELSPILSMHDSEYFIEDEISPQKASFEEQFAEYLVLRLYTDELGDAIGKLHSLIGDEWFEMMDRHYATVADRISERGKVFQKKKDTE